MWLSKFLGNLAEYDSYVNEMNELEPVAFDEFESLSNEFPLGAWEEPLNHPNVGAGTATAIPRVTSTAKSNYITWLSVTLRCSEYTLATQAQLQEVGAVRQTMLERWDGNRADAASILSFLRTCWWPLCVPGFHDQSVRRQLLFSFIDLLHG